MDYIYDKEIMGPEEFHYLDKFNNDYFRSMREVRISFLKWLVTHSLTDNKQITT